MTAVDVRKPIVKPPAPPRSSGRGAMAFLGSYGSPSTVQQFDGAGDAANGGTYGQPPATCSGPPRKVEPRGHVGIDSLPEQFVRKARNRGFSFNILCVGETGIGKSTLMESLFNMPLGLPPCSQELTTVELNPSTYEVTENNVHLTLTIVETAGFGDQLDKESSTKLIASYIERQFQSFLDEEMRIKRAVGYANRDSRVHACIYFISPTGHGLKALDVAVLKELSSRVNIIPVIAKADTISKDELTRFKSKILNDLSTNKIKLYEFPCEDESVAGVNSSFNSMLPFAVIGSLDTVQKGSKKVRARTYPWGMVEIENEEHCDFVKLREALLRTNVEDLRQRTHETLYENYRRQQLRAMGFREGDLGAGIQETYKQKMEEHRAEMAAKEQQLRDSFMAKAQKCEDELRRRERELTDAAQRERTAYEEDVRQLSDRERKVDQERAEFERAKDGYAATLGRRKK